MAEISNAYRDQVRELLRRRIQEARARLLDEHKGKVAEAAKKAEALPAIAEPRALKRQWDDLQKRIGGLEKVRDEVVRRFRELTEGEKTRGYCSYHLDDAVIESLKSKAVNRILSGDPKLGPQLKALDNLDAQISDLLVLALTTTKLRSVVKLFNDRLGASITEVEKEILGIGDD